MGITLQSSASTIMRDGIIASQEQWRGSGSESGSTRSTCFWASWIRIRILLSFSKNSKKTLISTVLWLLFDFWPLENDVKVPSKCNMQKNLFLNNFFVGILKVNVKIRRIRIRIRIHKSEAWIRGSRSGSGSTPKYHGSATLPRSKINGESYVTTVITHIV